MAEVEKTVLVVEDDPDVRQAISALLTDSGYSVQEARNGMEGLEVLRKGPKPGAILLDLMMPVMDGFDFRLQQLSDATIASVPVIILSAGGFSPLSQEALKPHAVLRKPIDVNSLLSVLQKL